MQDFEADPRAAAYLPALQAIRGMNRRHFLQAAAAVGAAAGGAGTLHASAPTMKFVGQTEARVFHKLLEVMLPVAGSPLLPPARVPVLQTLDAALLGTMEPDVLAGLKGGIAYWNDGPKAQFGRQFADLGPEDATRFCDLWADGKDIAQRALSMGLKKLVSLAYFANPPTWGPLGYGGPFTRTNNIPSIGNAPMPRR
jgi:hypothetical protein